jgi:hypothetical protein
VTFRRVAVGEDGYGVLWRTDNGEEIDLGSDSLRHRAERQAERTGWRGDIGDSPPNDPGVESGAVSLNVLQRRGYLAALPCQMIP